jgi:hypothetical protein
MPERKRKVYNDGLTGMMVLDALITFTTLVENKGCANNREQFDAILVSTHNKDMPTDKHISVAYLEEHSLRVSQKFAQIKQKMKDLNTPIHISLPRRTRSVGKEQLAALKARNDWTLFAKLNTAAGKKKK